MTIALHYDATLVVLSVTIAIFAAYTALELGDRAASAVARTRTLWILAAAVAMGGGIWAMHFVGMLAFNSPVPVTYDVRLTILSLMVAIAATATAFFWVNRRRVGRMDVVFGGIFMGGAIAGMHYIGMLAMRMPMSMSFDPLRILLSVAIAMAASMAGLAIAFRHHRASLRILAAIVMGLAVTGMHYTGMWAAGFGMTGPAAMAPMTPDGIFGADSLVLWIVVAIFVILFLALLGATISQHRSQKLLRTSEARFRVAADVVGDVIWTNTPNGEMRGDQAYWSRFTGQARPEYEGFGWVHALHADDVEPTLAAWNQAVASGQVFVFEHRVRRKDGVWRLCSVRAVPVFEAGQLQEWVGVHEDVTERHDAEMALRDALERAEAASRVKSQFIANMSHELRTPLSAIIGYSETIEEEAEDGTPPGQLLSDIRKIKSNARHLLGIINDILDLSKIEAGRMDVLPEQIDLAQMVRDVAATVQPLIGRNANRLQLSLDPEPGRMYSDTAKVRQMLLNLLSNAAKFTKGGTITLSVRRDDTWIVLGVTDTGIGMTAEQVSGLFQRFSQADASTTRRFGGTGLGLSLTRAFAMMLGGDITVTSIMGTGSVFTLRLPATWTSPELPEASAQQDDVPVPEIAVQSVH